MPPLTLGRSSAPQVSDLLQRLRQRGQAEDAALLPRLSRQVYRPVAEGDAGLHFTSSPLPPHPHPHSVQYGGPIPFNGVASTYAEKVFAFRVTSSSFGPHPIMSL